MEYFRIKNREVFFIYIGDLNINVILSAYHKSGTDNGEAVSENRDIQMKKVITYGTYDLLHQGHINLLKRAKALGDYLIVGVTNDNFDIERGKLNVCNNVLERVEAVKATGLADKIIIEDYIGQKIDDIQKYGVDIFTVGSDWEGHFDYLKEYCEVVYLTRTEGISSTMLRERQTTELSIGIVGCGRIANRFATEAKHVSGIEIKGCHDADITKADRFAKEHHIEKTYEDYSLLLDENHAVYIATPHLSHYQYIKMALERKKHVLCETPMVLKRNEAEELFAMAQKNEVLLMEANKTAHCPAFTHLVNMVKSGIIGEIVDIEASLSKLLSDKSLREFDKKQAGGSMYELGSYPLLPIIKLMGTEFKHLNFYSRFEDGIDIYTKGVICYPKAICSFKLGLGVKTEGNLVISGTKGYIYVPSPWWKTDFFEVRYEDQNFNKKFFYKWDEAGLRYELREFVSCILNKRYNTYKYTEKECVTIAGIMDLFGKQNNMTQI